MSLSDDPHTETRIQMCNDWFRASLLRMKRSEKQHQEVMQHLVGKLREEGIHALTSIERMDIAYYSVPRMYDARSFHTSSYRQECVDSFNFQSTKFRHNISSLSGGICFLTPHIHPDARKEIKIDIRPLFFALNSKIELSAPLNLLDLESDCLDIIGEMVKEDNRETWRYKYYNDCKERYGFVTYWAMSEMRKECKRMSDKHPYNIPMTIRNYNPVWRYRTEVVVVGKRWLDIWQACDALVRNAVNKDGEGDHHIFIEFIVQPDDGNGYELENFFAHDDPEYIRYCEGDEIDDDIWYLITGS